jgi:hypothetical protein
MSPCMPITRATAFHPESPARCWAQYAGPLFATTSNGRMKSTLGKARFAQKGQEWHGESGWLSLWLKS